MKKIALITFFLIQSLTCFSQFDCDYSTNVVDSIGSYKSTKEYLVYQRIFGNSQTSIYFSLINADGLLSLNLQMISKSSDFIAAKCFDKNSKIYLQMNNGKIATLIPTDSETCGNSINNSSQNIRILSGYFLFVKDNFEDLKTSPVSFIRINFAGETVDFICKSELISEIDKTTYLPESYFINFLKCVQ